ncbi:hypothetical protein H1P_3160007 [Hyella patelloides LEGE 07179]|uniref:Uncharacterized protein n=1 Tax=Hyella patelloides LEGE 07179 TaxID=945734 RepID=A0A563VUR1_9CYAN|nr:hypothetical protein H1P_3160007 [Hyella patelloides LEGE 07179]
MNDINITGGTGEDVTTGEQFPIV